MSEILDPDYLSQIFEDTGTWTSQQSEVLQRPHLQHRRTQRSSVACKLCRTRKIRCNVVTQGLPCSNCKHDEVDCLLPESRRRKETFPTTRRQRSEGERARPGSISSSDVRRPSAVRRPSDGLYEHQHEGLGSGQGCGSEIISTPNTSDQEPEGIELTDTQLAEIFKESQRRVIRDAGQTPPTSTDTEPWAQIQAPLASAPIPKILHSLLSTLPKVFAPFTRHLDAHDLTFLHARDAFTIPTETLQDFLKAYSEMVHPALPLLDWEDFVSVLKHGLDGRGGEHDFTHQIPLLLFQAVMYAGSRFVSLQVLQNAGYDSRESAERAFFSRARLLYDLETCNDKISVIQSLLLLTFCDSDLAYDSKDSWHWLGLAIALCCHVGLNRADAQIYTAAGSLRQTALIRRLWWTTFVRERTLSLRSEGSTWAQQIRIRRKDCSVPMISLQDFQIDKVDEQKVTGASIKKMQDAALFIEKAKLCWLLDDAVTDPS